MQILILFKRMVRGFGNLIGEGLVSVKGYNSSISKRYQKKVVNNGCYNIIKSWFVGVFGIKELGELCQEES